MTKEAFERAKKLDENIYYIKKLLNTLNDPALRIYSSITGKDFRMDEMKRELEDL